MEKEMDKEKKEYILFFFVPLPNCTPQNKIFEFWKNSQNCAPPQKIAWLLKNNH